MSTNQPKSLSVALLGLFSAIVVVLQLLSYTIKIGTFNLSLVLIPIVLAAVVGGVKSGAAVGLVFGVVVLLASAFGLDAGGNIVFNANPFLTTLICLIKGAAAGAIAGLIAAPLREKSPNAAVILAAVAAPIVNTGVFILGMLLFFGEILTEWAGGTALVTYVIFTLCGVNFLIEMIINVVLSPVILRVIPALRRMA